LQNVCIGIEYTAIICIVLGFFFWEYLGENIRNNFRIRQEKNIKISAIFIGQGVFPSNII